MHNIAYYIQQYLAQHSRAPWVTAVQWHAADPSRAELLHRWFTATPPYSSPYSKSSHAFTWTDLIEAYGRRCHKPAPIWAWCYFKNGIVCSLLYMHFEVCGFVVVCSLCGRKMLPGWVIQNHSSIKTESASGHEWLTSHFKGQNQHKNESKIKALNSLNSSLIHPPPTPLHHLTLCKAFIHWPYSRTIDSNVEAFISYIKPGPIYCMQLWLVPGFIVVWRWAIGSFLDKPAAPTNLLVVI